MRDRFETLGDTVPRPVVQPWAFPVNQTTRIHDIEITLLSFIEVGEFSRLTGLVRTSTPQEVRLASVPALSISSADGPPLVPVSAHVLPQGSNAWVSWLFRCPSEPTSAYEARIERVDLAYQIGKRPSASFSGPWVFRFELPPIRESAPQPAPEGILANRA